MATVESNVLIRVKDSSGNANLFYPITKADNVDGLKEALATKADASHGTHVTFSTTAPVAAGTASVGTATTVARSDHVHPAQTTVSGNAGTATKLASARTIRTNLETTSAASFDGSADITPGVTGTLLISNGGTGAATAAAARANLESTKIYWSVNEPSDWTVNDIWFQIV